MMEVINDRIGFSTPVILIGNVFIAKNPGKKNKKTRTNTERNESIIGSHIVRKIDTHNETKIIKNIARFSFFSKKVILFFFKCESGSKKNNRNNDDCHDNARPAKYF